MTICFAPMEGLTDAVFRRVHHACFPGVDAYYMPFLSLTQHLKLSKAEREELLPENCPGVPCVPQLLTRDESHFLWGANLLADLGYTEVNLNAGCPSATVIAKGKGAGILRSVKELDYFLEDVCARSPLPVSVKTRIGFETPEEWAALLAVYAQYPLKRLIIHPRTCCERYAPGIIHRECWQAACETYPGELIYNGDVFTGTQARDVLAASERPVGLMLGRGLVAQPALARELCGGALLASDELRRFHDALADALRAKYNERIAFMKLRVVMKHIACCFEDASTYELDIRKTQTLDQLLETDQRLFDECLLKFMPAYIPDELRRNEWAALSD